jgi:hypothetical protein
MIIKRAIAVESLTKVCEESLNLIKQLIDADNEVYAKGVEDGMAAQSEVQKTLRPWVGLTDEEIWETISRIGTSDSDVNPYAKLADARAIEAKLKEKNT